ncbi:NUDIX domain-containing protein [Glycomyces sambucus]|uniref:NUDIX domain-containing protein n=1 Tax=Glycomyces sambucus TaxID=380244 RepID=UPI0015A0B8EB|nr:NUDIX domain-containing protein [Glycomyces sambucus]
MRHIRLPAPVLRVIAPGMRLWWRVRKPETFGVKALLFHPDGSGRFLVVRHSYSDPRRWGLPGGGYKPTTEKPAQAIAREVGEELALTVSTEAFTVLDTLVTTLEGKRDTLTILRAVAPSAEVSLSPELTEFRWIGDVRQLEPAPVSRWLVAAVSHVD